MATLLISDLHLDQARPATLAALVALLRSCAGKAGQIYCLGDLFESWIGDDDDSELARAVADAFRAAADAGASIHFLAGNRDFLLGEAYAARCGMQRLADEAVCCIEGEATLLMHGDTLCTEDLAYQQVRAQLRDPAWQTQFLALPRDQRAAFAEQARARSREHTRTAQEAIMDVCQDAVRARMQAHGVRRMIHGHTHRPAVHGFVLEGDFAQRWVLGDWHHALSALWIDALGPRFLDPRAFGRLD